MLPERDGDGLGAVGGAELRVDLRDGGEDGWGRNYGARQHCRHGLRAFLDYDRKMAALCRARKDPDLVFVSTTQGMDPWGAYPTGRKTGNAMHATREGGKALGDAIFAWLISDIANR